MLKEEAEKIAKQSRIDITQVVREEWEIKILKVLFDSDLGKKIYFKGGTALRLAYGSPRFSEDLDFTLVKKLSKDNFNDFIKSVVKKYPEINISDQKEKFYTFLAEFKIKENYLPKAFSIKVEISKRQNDKYNFSLTLLTSATANIQVLANVENLEDIYREKIVVLKSRQKPRDLFDLWYISQKIKKSLPKNLTKIDKRGIKQELNKFLPLEFQSIVKQLEEQYGK